MSSRLLPLGFAALALCCLNLLACGSSSPTPNAKDESPAPTETTTPPTDPAPFSPMSSRDQSPPPTGDGGNRIEAPGASFTLPATWIREAPSSSMRLAQARIPGSAGEAQLTVFYFGPGGGGGVDANLERWVGQVEANPGTEPKRDGWSTDQIRVTWVDVSGTLKPSTMGTGPTTPQPDSRLLGAVVEGAGGPWFFKATGPAGTLDEQRQAFLDMLKSARLDG